MFFADQQVDKSPDELFELDEFHYDTFSAFSSTFESCVYLLEEGKLFDLQVLMQSLDELVVGHIFVAMKLQELVKLGDIQNVYNEINLLYDPNHSLAELNEVIKENKDLIELFEIIGKFEKQPILDFKNENIGNKIYYFSS